MDYFERLLQLLNVEKEEDRQWYQKATETLPVQERRAGGITWYPIAIRNTEAGRGDYLTVEVERTPHTDLIHQLRFGMSAALFSNHNARQNRVEGVVTGVSGNRLTLALRIEELPEWCRDGKLGIDAVFDENSYKEMQQALKGAAAVDEKTERGRLVKILTGEKEPAFNADTKPFSSATLNSVQNEAVTKILAANELAIVHGPPGTGKTTTLVAAVKAMIQQHGQQLLVVAPSNTAVDLLSERLWAEGLNVIRVGNPARVSERLMSLTLDSKIADHPGMKEIRRLKKRAAEFRELAQKYKRSFGREERDQRKALFAEARNMGREIEKGEQYITDGLLSKADVITATLVGANHYSVRQLTYHTVVIDEAGQALEPACWIPILKAQKLVLAGDHCQLPPTIKSNEAAKGGLAATLLEKCVKLHPRSVVLLEEQYRMHTAIMGYPSAFFYGNKLKAHPSVARHLLFPGDDPLLFIDTAGCGFEEVQEGSSISNPDEALFLAKHLAGFIRRLNEYYTGDTFPDMAVISPYKHQVEILKETLIHAPEVQALGGVVSVNTIDSFQGQERDVVYISMTRSNMDNNIGFLSEVRRMNVAMTRARKKLVVVGDSATLSQSAFYAHFITYAEQHHAYRSAWEFGESL